ncbi:hypothetical protein BGZ73_000084 [Actinomortierella ambigua]|nr:hypothetical protein BGZ73_000084 [Actinomortierella ambigua]
MSQQLRRLPFVFSAREPEYIRIEEDEIQDQDKQPQNTKTPCLPNVAKGDAMKRRADGSFSKADVLNSLVPIHHARWGGYTPKEIPPKNKSTSRSSSSSTVTNTGTTTSTRGGASFSSRFSTFTRPNAAGV